MRAFIRVINFAFQDIARNLSLSLMTVLILVLMLLSINTVIIINFLTNQAIQSVKEQIDISLYFNPEATNREVTEIQEYLSSFPEVSGLTFINREEVLVAFREEHKDNAEVLAALDELGENPLGPTLIVKTKEPQDYEKIITAMSVPEYENIIEAKTFADSEKAIERIQTITNQVEKFTLGLSILFVLISFLIIFNTIRVAIYTQRIEITIKKLVGATNWFVSGPYLVEALVFSVVSLGVASLIVLSAIPLLDPYVAVVFQTNDLLWAHYLSHGLVFILGQFAGVAVLTIGTSLLAMRRYLRV